MVGKILIYSKDSCKFCTKSKTLLSEKNIPYEEVKLNPDEKSVYEKKRNQLIEMTNGHKTFPWVFVGDEFVGGFSELRHLFCTNVISRKLKNIGIDYEFQDNDF